MMTQSQLALRAQARKDYQVIQNVSTAAYTTAFNLGAPMKIDNVTGQMGPNEESPLSSILQSLVLNDPDGLNLAMDLYFFNQLPSATYTDKTLFAPSTADMQNCIGCVHILTTDYSVTAASPGGSIASKANLGMVLKPSEKNTASNANGTGIWVVAVTRGTPTPVVGKYYFRFQFSNGL